MKQHNFNAAERSLMLSLRTVTYADAMNPGKPWRDDPKAGKARPLGYYVPTGNPMLDTILAHAKPRIWYGGNDSGVLAPTGDSEWTDYGTSLIVQPAPEQFETEDGRRAILAHELIHWTKELGRSPRPVHGVATTVQAARAEVGGDYVQEELVAEIGAALLLDACGATVNWKAHASYIGNWMTQVAGDFNARRAAVVEAMKSAERAVDYLLQFAEGV